MTLCDTKRKLLSKGKQGIAKVIGTFYNISYAKEYGCRVLQKHNLLVDKS